MALPQRQFLGTLTMLFRIFLVVVATLLFVAPIQAQIAVPNTFVPQTRILSADVNDNFTELGDKSLNRTGGTMLGNLTVRDVFPDGNNTRGLGTPGARWATVNSVLGNFSGAVSAAGFDGSGVLLTNIPETAITDGALLARVAANETISGAWTFANANTVAQAIQFTNLGGAAAGKIGLNANQLAFLGGSSGFSFLTPGGGPLATMSATGTLALTTAAFITADANANILIGNGRVSDNASQFVLRSNDGLTNYVHLIATSTPQLDIATGGAIRASLNNTGFTLASGVNATFGGTVTLSGTSTFNAPVNYTNISTVAVSADTNNWNPTGLSTANVILVNASGGDQSHNVTGLTVPENGRQLSICIISGSPTELNFQFESASSTAANRFQFATTLTLTGSQCVSVWYDPTSLRWRKLSS